MSLPYVEMPISRELCEAFERKNGYLEGTTDILWERLEANASRQDTRFTFETLSTGVDEDCLALGSLHRVVRWAICEQKISWKKAEQQVGLGGTALQMLLHVDGYYEDPSSLPSVEPYCYQSKSGWMGEFVTEDVFAKFCRALDLGRPAHSRFIKDWGTEMAKRVPQVRRPIIEETIPYEYYMVNGNACDISKEVDFIISKGIDLHKFIAELATLPQNSRDLQPHTLFSLYRFDTALRTYVESTGYDSPEDQTN